MNRTFGYALVDAFTTTPLGGNPCAVVFDADSLSAEEMLAIAREMNQSETAFVLRSERCDLRARYFTPEREIPLAGHPTIATVSAAFAAGLLPKSEGSYLKIRLELNDGPIDVEIDSATKPPLVRMFQRKPIFGETHDSKIVLPLFGLGEDDLLPGATIQTVSTGTRQMMVPLNSQTSLRKLSLKAEEYKAYRAGKDFFSPHLFCLGGISSDAATFARHPGVAPDAGEDAFTGSATGGMAAYLWRYGFLKDPKFIAEQGHWMARPGRAFVEVIGPRDGIESVVVAGSAVTVVRGELTL
jgi:trans-2,3-dihydro-3-hydroxyanthranilate isomerase